MSAVGRKADVGHYECAPAFSAPLARAGVVHPHPSQSAARTFQPALQQRLIALSQVPTRCGVWVWFGDCAGFYRWLRQGSIALAISMGLATNAYGNCGGGLDPTMRVGAPGIVAMEKPAPPEVIWLGEKGIFADKNAARNVWASTLVASGRAMPNTRVLAGLNAPRLPFCPCENLRNLDC